MKYYAIYIIFILGSAVIWGQDPQGRPGMNQLDDQGRKTGPWKVEYDNGNTRYEGRFREGKPVGMMKRYYETGMMQAKMDFGSGSGRCYAEMFYKKGNKAAEGIYVGQSKDSVWTYFSRADETVRIREGYEAGQLHGKSFRYYPDGTVSEEVTWNRGIREGPWIQYYEEGNVRLKSQYADDMLNGPYNVYHTDSTLIISGMFINDLTEGTWKFYDDTGSLVDSLAYRGGEPVDQEKYDRLILQDTLIQKEPTMEPEPFLQ